MLNTDLSGPHCVAPADVPQWWPFVGNRISEALRRGGGGTPVDVVRRDLEAGTALLWLAIDGSLIVGAAVTELVTEYGRKRCDLVAFAGDFDLCIAMLPALERYAAAEGGAMMRVMGRPGWRRRLADYVEPFVVLEKRL